MVKDEWVSAAMADDSVVVELLVRLKQSQASSPMKSPSPSLIPFKWGLRQRRSRIISPLRYDFNAHKNNKDSISTRHSPTTPLSWSGDTSLSEDSTNPTSFSHSSRSKGNGANEFSSSAMAKRLKRKKALADLKVEEGLLLKKERAHLKKGLGNLHTAFKEQTTSNEILKKVKLNLDFNTSDNFSDEPKQATYDQPCQSIDTHGNDADARSDSYKPGQINSKGDGGFFLPDLNMVPADL